MDKRRCCRCDKLQPIDQFYRNASHKTGRHPHCKTCHREAYRDSKRAYMRSETGRRKAVEASKRWAERNRERVRAHRKLQYALEAGKLKRPDACPRCGKKRGPGVIIDGHHADYSRPLDVTWLCRGCHKLEHAAGRASA